MKTKKRIFFSSNTNKFESVIPVECPHCGAYSTPQIVQDATAEFLGILPAVHKKPQLPESMVKISPRFVELYTQSFDAEQNSYFELAGSGYRNAIEILIKDFAINELRISEKEVCKKTLSKAIESYLPNLNASISADVMRVLGNDYTHYERRYKEIDFEILKRYLQIFISSIDCEYLIKHPVVPINPNLTD